jgi:LysR family transcriptional regulator, mexEF-oprN operon transcriptional activator
MASINQTYARDFDLNLLRVFVVVAELGSVTQAAAQLYLTQPAVSAALRRLHAAIGAPVFARDGRGLTLTKRGEQLLEQAKPHLSALLSAALSPPSFDPMTSERTIRLGLSDAFEGWLLPRLLQTLASEAPNMRVIALPIQFRTVASALALRSVELAITVADELPTNLCRLPLFTGGFVCLFDPRHVRVKGAFRERDYFGHEHVIVSYNGDLRGVIEDTLKKQRNVRCSVSSFGHVGAVVDGSPLLATVPEVVAEEIRLTRPHLRTAKLPLRFAGSATELIWPLSLDDDDALRFVRESIVKIVQTRTKRKR